MPLAHVNGADVHFTDTGAPADRPDAPVVLFGHGLLFSGWMFSHQVDALKDEYRCVTIDWRSQGQSPAARDGHLDRDRYGGVDVHELRHRFLGARENSEIAHNHADAVGSRVDRR